MTNETPTRWPIRQVSPGIFVLEDIITGKRISWHRTQSGALRKRRELIEDEKATDFRT